VQYLVWKINGVVHRIATASSCTSNPLHAANIFTANPRQKAACEANPLKTGLLQIGQELTTVSVLVQQPAVKHEVWMKDFLSWLERQGRSPAEVMLKQELEKILGKVNQART
jgi:hypothetical protein